MANKNKYKKADIFLTIATIIIMIIILILPLSPNTGGQLSQGEDQTGQGAARFRFRKWYEGYLPGCQSKDP